MCTGEVPAQFCRGEAGGVAPAKRSALMGMYTVEAHYLMGTALRLATSTLSTPARVARWKQTEGETVGAR
eukprot:gene2376-biopygen11431